VRGGRIILKKKIVWQNIPEFMELANKMGVTLHKKRPFGVQDNLKNAITNSLKKQIIFGEPVLKDLTEEEKLALAAHELTHLQKRHALKSLLAYIGAFVPFVVIRIFIADEIILLVGLVLALLVLILIKRHYEYEADSGAVINAGKIPTLSFFRKQLELRDKKDLDKIFHPPLEKRITRIENNF